MSADGKRAVSGSGDKFPEAHRRFTSGMDRLRKVNLLREHAGDTAFWARLREDYPGELARHLPPHP